jgi:hypothetical protein
MLVRWWTGPPVVVIAPNPPEPAIQMCTSKARGDLQAWSPMGPIEVRRLTKAEERFLLSKGMHPGLFSGQRVFAVSNEAANRFDTGLKTFMEIAERCGLSRDDLSRIAEAKKKLRAFHPSSLDERRAARGLREFLAVEQPWRGRGRPGRVTADDRRLMHADARQLRQEGKTTDEIVRTLAQRYELRASYTRRILEDASSGEPS